MSDRRRGFGHAARITREGAKREESTEPSPVPRGAETPGAQARVMLPAGGSSISSIDPHHRFPPLRLSTLVEKVARPNPANATHMNKEYIENVHPT